MPLHAAPRVSVGIFPSSPTIPTELLLDDLENLLLIKLLRKSLDSGQGLTPIALWSHGQLVGSITTMQGQLDATNVESEYGCSFETA